MDREELMKTGPQAVVHYGPGDRPLCGPTSWSALPIPLQVHGCPDCAELVMDDLATVATDLDQQRVADALDLWIGRQPRARMLNIQALGRLFAQS